MEGKAVIVTGGNNGIGKETARELAKMGARIILACRNLETGKKALEEIIEETKNENVILKKIDLSSFQSIRDFAEDINKTELRLDVLVHNAGVWLSENSISQDGIELTMATNHFGPFLLTHLLIDLLKKSTPSRIVVVSSVSHFFGILNTNKIQYNTNSFFPVWNYFNSKLANVCFTRELSRRLKDANITVNSVHPGLINTEIWNSLPKPFSWLVNLINKSIFKTSEEGCETIVYLASSEEVANVTGKYFVNCKKAFMSPRARNLRNNIKLWETSGKVVKLESNDPKI